ncbi:Proline permease [Arachnia propionica]|nr:Proline permease [Arachnia propionica]
MGVARDSPHSTTSRLETMAARRSSSRTTTSAASSWLSASWTMVTAPSTIFSRAAIMSTISSQLLVSSSALVEDLYKVFRKDTGRGVGIWMGRGAVMLVSVVAAAMAWEANDTILNLVAFAWAGFGATFGPVVLLSLYWRRLTTGGALAGMIAGAIAVAIWGSLSGGIFDLYEILPGFVINLAVAVGISLASRPAPEVEQDFKDTARLVTHFQQGELVSDGD